MMLFRIDFWSTHNSGFELDEITSEANNYEEEYGD
jgi:hypothetical protein